MPARIIAYLPEQAALSRVLSDGAFYRIGRGDDCDIALADASVSRFHASIAMREGIGALQDEGSKNGTFVDGKRIDSVEFAAPCWLRFGDIYCEYEPLDQAAVDQHAHRLEGRRAQSQMLLDQLGRHAKPEDLAAETLRAVVELAECERGILLLAQQGRLVVHATLGLDPEQLRAASFGGSVGALNRALKSRRPVVINDVAADPEMRARRSVVDAGLRTLICLPILVGADLVGIVYADSTRPGAVLTDLDTELLEAFIERAALWLAVRANEAELTRLHNAETIGWLDLLHLHAPSTQ